MNVFDNILNRNLIWSKCTQLHKILIYGNITITNGTASRNFFTLLFDDTSVRKRFPWPAHKTFDNLPMSLSWIHIRIFDGLITMPIR